MIYGVDIFSNNIEKKIIWMFFWFKIIWLVKLVLGFKASEVSLSKLGNTDNILRNASNYHHVFVFFVVPTIWQEIRYFLLYTIHCSPI
jgi:hypothetical protein